MTSFGMIFPGQGSQYIGMLSKFFNKYKIIKDTFDEASYILGYDLWKIVSEGPIKELNKTSKAQPAILASSIAIWRIWNQEGGKNPNLLAGHSLGEYSALVCSGSLSFSSAIDLVQSRALLMQKATPIGVGSMAVIIGLDKNLINYFCKKLSKNKIVSLANFNSPYQSVISGHKDAVYKVSILCKKFGARILILPISISSHCSLMKSAAKNLLQKLNSIKLLKPKIPILNNVDVKISKNLTYIRKALIRQLYNPVRWTEIIKYFANKNIKILFEIGPNKILTKLNIQITKSINCISVNDPFSLNLALKH